MIPITIKIYIQSNPAAEIKGSMVGWIDFGIIAATDGEIVYVHKDRYGIYGEKRLMKPDRFFYKMTELEKQFEISVK